MTAKEYLRRVHLCDCVVCVFLLGHRTPMQEAHHVVPGDNWGVVPLCREHHQGSTGVHGMHRRPFYLHWGISEPWLLARTVELVAKL